MKPTLFPGLSVSFSSCKSRTNGSEIEGKGCKSILDLAHCQEGQRSYRVKLWTQTFIEISDSHSSIGLIFFISKKSDIQVNQTLFCKVKLGIFGLQCWTTTSENTFKSEPIWDYSFGSLFCAPEPNKDPLFNICLGSFIFHCTLFLREISQEVFNGKKSWHILPHDPNTVQTGNKQSKQPWMSGPATRMRKWNQFSQFRWTSTKVKTKEKT